MNAHHNTSFSSSEIEGSLSLLSSTFLCIRIVCWHHFFFGMLRSTQFSARQILLRRSRFCSTFRPVGFFDLLGCLDCRHRWQMGLELLRKRLHVRRIFRCGYKASSAVLNSATASTILFWEIPRRPMTASSAFRAFVLFTP